jgi:hypothetical protein
VTDLVVVEAACVTGWVAVEVACVIGVVAVEIDGDPACDVPLMLTADVADRARAIAALRRLLIPLFGARADMDSPSL